MGWFSIVIGLATSHREAYYHRENFNVKVSRYEAGVKLKGFGLIPNQEG